MAKKYLWKMLPEKPGVYLFKDGEGKIIYVGKAINLKKRASSYFSTVPLGDKTQALVKQIKSIDHIIVENGLEALLLEANLIKQYQPRYNVRFSDGKAYPFIKITIKDDYPKVLEARKILDQKSLYFGPYPTVSAMRMVLRTIRKIFPYQSVEHHPKRPCLYYHLGLCPCPGVFDSKTMQLSYRKTIRYLVAFLQGRKKDLRELLIKQMKMASEEERFEDAALLKKQIEEIELVTSPLHKPIEYLENPNLSSDERKKELSQLRDVLSKNGVNLKRVMRLECYDISNMQGKNATGSMVVFVNGEKESPLYRHFKIRIGERPNDVAMMKEIIVRRLKHNEWDYPNLIIVDGGKGQVYAVSEVLREKAIMVPVIGLAKRFEEIVILKDGKFALIRLPLNSPALNLLRRIRDEAHRFALQYHRKLRSKAFKN